MIDSSRRTVLTTGAAAAAATAAPRVLAQTPQAAVPQGLPAGAKVGFYEKGDVRIRYAEIGSGFPLLAAPGGGLNSAIAVWISSRSISRVRSTRSQHGWPHGCAAADQCCCSGSTVIRSTNDLRGRLGESRSSFGGSPR